MDDQETDAATTNRQARNARKLVGAKRAHPAGST
jgi:hypothetical protein